MQDELKNILSDAQGNISDDELMQYLKRQLEGEEQHNLEQRMAGDAFENDAVEGLQEVENKEKIALIVDGLNRDLKKRTAKKNLKRSSGLLKPEWWLYFTVLILLILIVMVFFFFHQKA